MRPFTPNTHRQGREKCRPTLKTDRFGNIVQHSFWLVKPDAHSTLVVNLCGYQSSLINNQLKSFGLSVMCESAPHRSFTARIRKGFAWTLVKTGPYNTGVKRKSMWCFLSTGGPFIVIVFFVNHHPPLKPSSLVSLKEHVKDPWNPPLQTRWRATQMVGATSAEIDSQRILPSLSSFMNPFWNVVVRPMSWRTEGSKSRWQSTFLLGGLICGNQSCIVWSLELPSDTFSNLGVRPYSPKKGTKFREKTVMGDNYSVIRNGSFEELWIDLTLKKCLHKTVNGVPGRCNVFLNIQSFWSSPLLGLPLRLLDLFWTDHALLWAQTCCSRSLMPNKTKNQPRSCLCLWSVVYLQQSFLFFDGNQCVRVLMAQDTAVKVRIILQQALSAKLMVQPAGDNTDARHVQVRTSSPKNIKLSLGFCSAHNVNSPPQKKSPRLGPFVLNSGATRSTSPTTPYLNY